MAILPRSSPASGRFGFLVVGALALAACATRGGTGTAQPCTGSEYLVVRNETGESIDVFSGAALLATVGPGSTELVLPPGRRLSISGRRTSTGAHIPTDRARAPLAFRILCR